MAINSGRLLMRRGNEADFDADKLMPGEWGVSTDKRYVRMCFSPGVCVRMATYEAFEKDMEQIAEILAESKSIEEAVNAINTQVSTNAGAVAEYTEQAETYRNEAEQFRNEAQRYRNEAESIKNNDYIYALNKPRINNVELIGSKSLEELGIQPAGSYSAPENTGNKLSLSINEDYIMKIQLLNENEEVLSEKTLDLPLESVVVNASYEAGNLILTLQNGSTVPVSLKDMVTGLVNDDFTIAGIDLKDNITAEELKTALSLDKVANAAPIANLLTTVAGSPLDATMGKELSDRIDGLSGSGGAGLKYYVGTCSTSGSTSSKIVSITNFKLEIGAVIAVKFTYINTSNSATLNVSSTGAVPMYYMDGTRMYYIQSDLYHYFIYDGSYWRYVGTQNAITGVRSYERYGLKMNGATFQPINSSYRPNIGASSNKIGYVHSDGVVTGTMKADSVLSKVGGSEVEILPPYPLMKGHFLAPSQHSILLNSDVTNKYVKSYYTGYISTGAGVSSSGCAVPCSAYATYDGVLKLRIIGYEITQSGYIYPFSEDITLSTSQNYNSTSGGCAGQSTAYKEITLPGGNNIHIYVTGISTDECGYISGSPTITFTSWSNMVHFLEIDLMQ